MRRSAHLDPLPADSDIQLVEVSDERLVVVIPPGSKRGRSMAWFAFIWLLITSLVSAAFLMGSMSGGNNKPDRGAMWFVGSLLGLFFCVGLVLVYSALRLSRTRLLLALEPHQLALRDEFLGRSKTSVLPLDATSHAYLEEAYSENDVPVYRVRVSGLGEPARFGTGCSQREKDWLVQSFNHFLNVNEDHADAASEPETTTDSAAAPETDSAASLDKAAAPVFGSGFRRVESVPELSPDRLPEDSRVRVDDTEAGVFQISYLVLKSSKLLAIPFVMVGIFELLWVGIIISVIVTAAGGDRDAMTLIAVFGVFMIVIGLAPIIFLTLVKRARVSISITEDVLIARIGAANIGWHRAIPRDSILDVGIGQGQGPSNSARPNQAAVIWSNHTTLPVAISGDRQFLMHLAGLIRYGLQQRY